MKPVEFFGRVQLIWRAFGARGLVRRATYVAQLRSGWLRRRLPATPFDSIEAVRWTYRFDLDEIRRRYDEFGLTGIAAADSVERSEALFDGRLSFYGGRTRAIGSPPRWSALPDGGPELASTHCTIGSDDLDDGDIKDVWEPSRFGFTFTFARAYVTTGDDRWVERWWQLFEHWTAGNPPNVGPNWRCGQESSLRAIAVCFALSTFSEHPASTPVRLDLAHRFLGATRTRVTPTVGYALSQRNNHAISELVFLASLPGGANTRWQRLLREALQDQWYPDGSYSQQSLVYERLAIHTLVWLLHVQPELDAATTEAVRTRLATAADFVERLTDPVAHRLPNSGANDGALLFDLDATERWDAAPLLSLLRAGEDRPSEARAWLPPDRLGLGTATTADSSFVTQRGDRSLLLTHIGVGRHRAGDDDQQGIELIVDGEPVVLDPGTFRYSGRAPWRQPFTQRGAHSMATPAVAEGGRAVGRFLRKSMPAAELVHRSTVGEDQLVVSVRHDGACRLTRAIVRRGDRYFVADHTRGGAATLSWLLPADAIVDTTTGHARVRHAAITFRSRRDIVLVDRSDEDPTSGWWSPLYGERWEATMIRVPLDDGDAASASFAPAGETPLMLSDVRPTFDSAEMSDELVAKLEQLAQVMS